VIIEFLKEERTHIRTLQALLDMAENNDVELQGLYEDSPVTSHHRRRLGNVRMGTHATMGRTTASR
jgi:hypothetical protein